MKLTKLFLTFNSFLLLASSIIPGIINDNNVVVHAEEKTVVSGKASSYLQQKNKEYFDDEDLDFLKSTYLSKNRDDYEVFEYNTDFMDSYFDYIYENRNDTIIKDWSRVFNLYRSDSSTNPLNKTQVSGAGLFIDVGTYGSLFNLKGSFNYEFERIENDKGQALPIEFKLDLGFDFLKFYKDLFLPYQYDFEMPLLEIDGQTILSLVKNDGEISIATSGGANVYLDKTTESIYENYRNRFVYVEIPYRRHIETVSAMFWRIYTSHERSMLNNYGFITIGTYEFLVQNLYLEKDCYNHSVFGPILINDIDFNTGVISTISSVSASRYVVDSITINDELEIDCEIRNLNLFHNVLALENPLYDKMQQYNLKYKGESFTYETASCDFFDQLKNANQEVDFYITEIKYHITLGKLTNDVADSLMVTPDDWKRTLDPTAQFGKSKIESLVQLPSRLKNQSSSTYAVTAAAAETTILDYVIDCGQYYKFKYVDKTTIHTADFDANFVKPWLSTHTWLYFNIFDNIINSQINELHGLMFYYGLKSENYKIKHGFTILSADGIQGSTNYWERLKQTFSGDGIKKTDESTGVEFQLSAVSNPDAFRYESYKGSSCPYNFVLVNVNRDERVEYKKLISFIYVNEAGDIINCSDMTYTDLFGETHSGLTAFDENGKTVIKDSEGNDLPLHYDKKTGVLEDMFGREVDSDPNIPTFKDKKTFWDNLKDFFTTLFKWIPIIIVVGLLIYAVYWFSKIFRNIKKE